MSTDFLTESTRQTPVVADVDVLVAGGGPAGIAAAVCAAREGAKTLLVERYGYLGGMITGANVIAVIGAGDGEKQIAQGITQEIRDRLEPLGAVSEMRFGDYRVDAEIFKWQAVEMLCEAGADILLHALACEPIMADGRVGGAIIESKSGRQAIRAKVTVDCTADADLAHRAGCESDNETHDVTLGHVVQGVDQEKVKAFRDESPEEYDRIAEHVEEHFGGVFLGGSRYMKDVDITDAAALTRAEIDARREYFGALQYLREHLPGYEDARIAATRPQLGVRQSRRIHGEYTFTIDDLKSGRHFDDGIARLGCYLVAYRNNYSIPGLGYDVPYRCLVPGDRDGMLVAGRCVSCDYESCNTLRLIVPCFATGQAAGVAAAMAVSADCAPRSVFVARLREVLREHEVFLG